MLRFRDLYVSTKLTVNGYRLMNSYLKQQNLASRIIIIYTVFLRFPQFFINVAFSDNYRITETECSKSYEKT